VGAIASVEDLNLGIWGSIGSGVRPLGHHIAGVGHMGPKGQRVGPQGIRAHHGAGRIHGHHHRLALRHPGQLSLGFVDGRAVGEGFAGAEHRLQQGPHRRPVGRLKGANQQRRSGGGQSIAAVV
jgi:hypothetical protein